jgi:hypothetical protein
MIQPYFGLQCLNGPTSLVWTPTTTQSLAITTSPTCPYITDPESTLACQMYNYLSKLQGASSGGSSMTSSLLSQLIAESLFKASGSGSGTNVNCAYSSNPTSANLLCYLYCMIQLYYGLLCLDGPTSLVWIPTTTKTIAITTSPTCPYSTDPESTLACQMYIYLSELQGASSGGSLMTSQLTVQTLFKGSGSGSGTDVICVYSSNPTSAELLCSLYCMIQPYFGLQCMNGPSSFTWSLSSTTKGISGKILSNLF